MVHQPRRTTDSYQTDNTAKQASTSIRENFFFFKNSFKKNCEILVKFFKTKIRESYEILRFSILLKYQENVDASKCYFVANYK